MSVSDKEEMLDIFNEHMQLVGIDSRENAHRHGLWHQTFHCWIVRKNKFSDGLDTLLFQQRSVRAKNFPGLLDITSAGHLAAGETVKSAVREIEEELGLRVPFEELMPLGIRRMRYESSEIRNFEFAHTYLVRFDGLLADLTLQEDEVGGIYEVPIEDVIEIFSGKQSSIAASGYRLSEGTLCEHSWRPTQSDILAHGADYYCEVAQLAKRYLAGECELSISDAFLA